MNTGDELTILVVAGIRYSGLLVSSDGGLMQLCSVQIRFKLRLNSSFISLFVN